MREFDVLVLQDGATQTRHIQALDLADARRLLRAENMHPLRITARANLTRSRRKFALGLFIQELATLLDAGLALVEAIEALHEKAAAGDHRRVQQSLLDCLYLGQPLSQALAAQPAVFPPLLVASVASAEHSGQLPQTLKRFHHYETRLDTLRKRVRSTLLYPSIVLTVGALILVFLLGFVIPRFATVFAGMTRLSAPAEVIVWWGALVATHGGTLLFALGAGLAALVMLVRHAGVQQRAWRLATRIPKLREQHTLFVLTRFYRTLGLLLEGGMPALDALKLTGALLPPAHHARLLLALDGIREGQALSKMLEQHDLTTPVAARLLRVGERSGELAHMCERIAQFHDDALERTIDTFSKVFEPVLMLAVGGVIGAVVFFLYMPIFELAGSVSS